MAGFRKWAEAHVELVNHALAFPERPGCYHVCWGNWKGPHRSNLPLREVIDLVLRVKASQYSVEASNSHEHEWKAWKEVKLPEAKAVIPRVVTHKTNVLELPRGIGRRREHANCRLAQEFRVMSILEERQWLAPAANRPTVELPKWCGETLTLSHAAAGGRSERGRARCDLVAARR
jgi:methionine synthase II (cobalamin-independent)